jgi:four helix bundle protein
MLIEVIKNWLHAARFTLHARWSQKLQHMRDFKKLLIWQMGMDIVKQVYKVVKHLPEKEKFGLRYQMAKSSVSIPSNIAEGSAKRSEKDYHRFVEIALGSAYELETQALVVESQGWVPGKLMQELLDLIRREQQMVTRFMDKL